MQRNPRSISHKPHILQYANKIIQKHFIIIYNKLLSKYTFIQQFEDNSFNAILGEHGKQFSSIIYKSVLSNVN